MAAENASIPVIQLTESAVSQVKSLLAKEAPGGDKTLRVYVDSGGCSGMKYGMVFDENREGDLKVESGGVRILVDSFSVPYLRGSVVDYKDDLNESGFKIKNPNAAQTCGCGKSFGIGV